MKDDRDHLVDISESLERIEKYASPGRSAFDRDELVECWIVRHLRILCEACDALSPAFRSAHPGIPWMRLIHLGKELGENYFDFDRDAVWKSVQTDLPPLQNHLDQILKEYVADE